MTEVRKNYTEEFKKSIVRKVLLGGGAQRQELAAEHGFHPSSISRWITTYGITGVMKTKKSKSPHNWSAEEKLKAIEETSSLNEEELGDYLRREGLHSHHLQSWRGEILSFFKSKTHPKKKAAETVLLEKEVKFLQRNLVRKEKALAEAAALLVLKKKADAYFSDEE